MTGAASELDIRLRRLARRLAVGVFLDLWLPSAAALFIAAGVVALLCRMVVPAAADAIRWLWIAPVVAMGPALILAWRRRFTSADVVTIADWLAGGPGTLMAVTETGDTGWLSSTAVHRASAFPLPHLRAWRKLAMVLASAAFLGVAVAVPQRVPRASTAVVAKEIAGPLEAAAVALKQQQMLTPEDEKTLEETIERIRRGAEQRVDASSWEAADALREKLAADVAGKQDTVKWAEASLARYAEAAAAAGESSASNPHAAELSKVLEALAKSGLLSHAPDQLQRLARSGKLPVDPAALRNLQASLAKYLAEMNGRFGELGKLGRDFGRFNPGDFPLNEGSAVDGDGEPGRGAPTRGRADAALTWGKETSPFDRFKATALPPGAPRSPDDWAPVVELPGAPQADPVLSAAGSARQYAAAAGQSAWRRGLSPRHQSAVKKYFGR
ncbi:MAG TPA: hypothetical protein VFT47_12310 [Vicinamibacterales bacterium]|nr:hypothetical protein [Vicinamibacterales bacterium]